MEEVSPLHQAQGLCARNSVSTLITLPSFYCLDMVFENMILAYRHVKGRVLVGLSDGTLAIFHRGVGEALGFFLFIFLMNLNIPDIEICL